MLSQIAPPLAAWMSAITMICRIFLLDSSGVPREYATLGTKHSTYVSVPLPCMEAIFFELCFGFDFLTGVYRCVAEVQQWRAVQWEQAGARS